MSKTIKIGSRLVGEGQPCFIIAEAGVNHDGSLEKAMALVDAAVAAKADAVKFQTFRTAKLIVPGVRKAAYHARTTGESGTFDAMLKDLELSEDDFAKLAKYSASQKIVFISTPFDEESADLLEKLGVPAFKVDSGNFNNHRLVGHIAKKGLPIILSTGMTTLGEMEETIDVLRAAGNHQYAFLHCTSNYPPSFSDVNLRAIKTMREAFEAIVGYSDHCTGITISAAAVALGAAVIEKHLTLDRHAPGPDHLASIEPKEFGELVTAIRSVETALGSSVKKPVSAEREIIHALRRSLVSTVPISKGTVITEDMIAIKRPGTGLLPKYYDWILGRPARVDIASNEVITFEKV